MKVFVDFDQIKQSLFESGKVILSERTLALELGINTKDAKKIMDRDFVDYEVAVKISRIFPDAVYVVDEEFADSRTQQ